MFNKKYLFNGLLIVFGGIFILLFFFDSQIEKIERKIEKAREFVEKHDISPRGGVKDVLQAGVTALKYETGTFKPDQKISVPIKGNLRVEIIDKNTVCLVGDYYDFIKERFVEECGSFLKGLESDTGNVPTWSKDLFYNNLLAEIIIKYRPVIAAAYREHNLFKLSNGIRIIDGGYWVNPIGEFVVPNLKDGSDHHTHNAQVAHYAYLRLETPLQENVEYVLQNQLGESVKFRFNELQNICGAIKINQLGYSPNAGEKYAYVGLWLGTLGALDLSHLYNKTFFLKDEKTGENVYRGLLTKRVPDVQYKGGAFFTGEDVYQADFSRFNQEGTYYIYIPGMGRSYSFEIGENPIGEAFYVHAKGLYHKRCGIAKESPYTGWHMGKCHTVTYKANFPPNDGHYNKAKENEKRDYGFFDENGNSVEVRHFKLINEIQTEEIAEGVSGGWHDAADYDRRPYHYQVVNALLSVYLMHPENFLDGQLNIPESGNGIPDILDEALWGMEVWRKAQLESGAVGGWIEATSHPKERNASIDKQHYYLSAATMESSVQYAAHASMLALALKKANQQELSDLYLDSAVKAYRFGMNPTNRFTAEYMYPLEERVDEKVIKKKVKYSYREPASVGIYHVFKAAFNLYLLTHDEKYIHDFEKEKKNIRQNISDISWKLNSLYFTELCVNGKDFELKSVIGELYQAYKKRVLDCADGRLKWLSNNYPYRIPWYPMDHGYVTHMSWGVFHPLRNATFFMLAYEFTGEKKYRDAVYLCADWHNGANPRGQTMTSGLGYNYPVKFLDLISYADGIPEYVLGITPYQNTFGIPREDVKLVHALYYDPRADRKFEPKPVLLLPESCIGASQMKFDDFQKKLASLWPVWRRFGNVEQYTVAASEYTVHETIAPALAAMGWLLNEPWMPSEEIKNRKPVEDIGQLKGYTTLP